MGGLQKFSDNKSKFVTVRNKVKALLHQRNGGEFAYIVGTSMNDLTTIISATDCNAETTKTMCDH